MARVPGIVVVQDLLRDSVEHLFRKDSKQLPSNVEGLKYRSILIDTYRHNRNNNVHTNKLLANYTKVITMENTVGRSFFRGLLISRNSRFCVFSQNL